MDEHAVEVVNLTKKFGDFTAVDHINFTIRRGEIFGFLGPNGAHHYPHAAGPAAAH